MRIFYQNLNSPIRWPSPVFGPEDETGNDGGEGDEDAGADTGNDDAGKQETPPSKFDKGLGKFRTKEEEEGDGTKEPGEKEVKEPAADGRPDHIPAKFWDAEKKEIKVDAMAKAYSTAEKALRSNGKGISADVPESEDDYFKEGVQLDETVTNIGLETDDPGLKVAAGVFKRYGIGKEVANNIVKDMFKGMNEHAPTPIDPDQELKSLGPNGRAVIDGTTVWLEKLDREGQLSDEDANVAVELLGTARGVRFLNKLRGMTGEMAIPTGHHNPPSGGMSPNEWHSAMMKAVGEKDYKEQERLDKISASVFGNGASPSSPIRGIQS